MHVGRRVPPIQTPQQEVDGLMTRRTKKDWKLPSSDRRVRRPTDPEPVMTLKEKLSTAWFLGIVGVLLWAAGMLVYFLLR